ncbi:unnamed protein product, partial [Ilex paraguariensis]
NQAVCEYNNITILHNESNSSPYKETSPADISLHSTAKQGLSLSLMAWLNLRRLLPTIKAWKDFTTKLQSKLHKLNRSKAIKKPRNHTNLTSKAVFRPSLRLQPRLKRQRGTLQPGHALRYNHRYRLQKRPKPVCIDHLLVEPVPVVRETTTVSKEAIEKCSTSANKTEHTNQQTREQGMIKEDDDFGKDHSADDLWESMVLASPQMRGINERAEEFITRFRGEMQLQEMIARHL